MHLKSKGGASVLLPLSCSFFFFFFFFFFFHFFPGLFYCFVSICLVLDSSIVAICLSTLAVRFAFCLYFILFVFVVFRYKNRK